MTNIEATGSPSAKTQTFTRFDLLQRGQHLIFLISFTILGITGLAQKFSTSPISLAFFSMIGVEAARLIHRISATVMGIVSAMHILELLYRLYVLRTPLTMLPWIDDIKHVIQDFQYWIGLRPHRARYGRYSYAEKAEYLALVWGTIVMGITGFMMWNPLTTVRYLPGEAIPAAKAAHGGEAILAVLAIILWHFYHVHIRHFNKSMFTGKMTREEMEHEHPLELEAIESRPAPAPIPPNVLRRRQAVYFPAAAFLAIIFGWVMWLFLFSETTAVAVAPPGETAPVFVQATPTPRDEPIAAPTPTLLPGVQQYSWEGTFGSLLRDRCSTCHGFTSVGGLSLADYQSALKGGNNGPSIVPGDPDASILVTVQAGGKHPGQLTPEELQLLIDWIEAGAPER